MGTEQTDRIKMKVFQKGQVVIPVALRKKYGIQVGDLVDVVPTPEGILLKAASHTVRGGSLTERLHGVFSEFAAQQPEIEKSDITKATEKGFTQGQSK